MTHLRVRDVMTTDPITLDEDEDLDLAGQLMNIARIRHLPVVRDDELVGLVSNRDLLRTQSELLSGDESSARQDQDMRVWTKASWVMTREVRSVEPDTPLLEAAHTMRRHKYGCLTVVSEGKLVGILTETDFVEYVIRLLEDPGV